MRIILGLTRPTSGKALVFGDDLGSNDELRRKAGILLENDGLYDGLFAYENLDYYAQLYNVPDREEKIENLSKEQIVTTIIKLYCFICILCIYCILWHLGLSEST